MRKIKIVIFQNRLVPYRVQVFNILARDYRTDLTLMVGGIGEGMGSGTDGLDFKIATIPSFNILGGKLTVHRGIIPFLEATKCEVLVLPGNIRYLSLRRVIKYCNKNNVKVVWWSHWKKREKNIILGLIRRSLMRMCDAILLYTKTELLEARKYSFKQSVLGYTGNTIDHESVELAKRKWNIDRLSVFKKTQGLENIDYTLLFCSRLTAKTRLDILLFALKDLFANNKSVKLIVIGDGEERKRFQNLAQKINIDSRIIWVSSTYNEYELAPWFMSADVFVYPGSIGLSLIHAYYYELPVILHDRREAHGPEIEIFESGKNGWSFEYDNQDSLRKVLIFTAKMGLSRVKMGQAGYKCVKSEHTMGRMSGRISNIIAEVTTEKNGH